MLAQFSRRFIAFLVVLSVIVGLFLARYSPVLAALALLSIGWVLSLVLAIECAASACVNVQDDVPQASMHEIFFAWLREIRVAIKVFLWWQPFLSQQHPDIFPGKGAQSSCRGVILVHGFLCNRGIWNAWYPVLATKRIPYIAINLEPVVASIECYGDILDDAVTRMHNATGIPPLLVCHSMGGLVVRAWLRATQADARTHRVVTIGSPHKGTRVGNWAPQWPHITNAHQMRSGSSWLEMLVQQESSVRRSKFICFHSNCDNIVFPATNATLPDADNRHIAGVPHLALAQDKRIMDQALALL